MMWCRRESNPCFNHGPQLDGLQRLAAKEDCCTHPKLGAATWI